MELGNPSNGDDQPENTDGNGASLRLHCYTEEIDSSCSTPYVSAPSSPGRGGSGGAGYFFSAPTSPMHFVLSSTHFSPPAASASPADALDFEFEFSSRCPSPGGGDVEAGSMSSADELFFNGQIRPMKLSSHLQRPQLLAPLLDVEEEEEDAGGKAEARGRDSRLRSRSVHRRARSMSPLRQSRFQWAEEEEDDDEQREKKEHEADPDLKRVAREGDAEEAVTPNSGSASSSRSSSSGRNSKRWIFLKDLLYRSKSEGRERERGGGKEKFWHAISFSSTSSRDKPKPTPPSGDLPPPPPATDVPKSRQKGGWRRAAGGAAGAKRRGPVPSPHERHYTANRAQAEEMRRRTFLPYRQGLLGCLGLSSRGYAAMNGLARSLQPVPSR